MTYIIPIDAGASSDVNTYITCVLYAGVTMIHY